MLLFRREWHQAIFITVFGASIWFQFIGSERGDYQEEEKMQKEKEHFRIWRKFLSTFFVVVVVPRKKSKNYQSYEN
jgi:hypothetical protein